jgi:polysaccharide deacetylase 2 family uncharacterized protein YibQ
LSSTGPNANVKEIERPLGQDANGRRQPSTHRVPLSGKSVVVAACVLGLVAVSTAISLRDQPFRTPVTVATLEPDAKLSPEPANPTDAGSADKGKADRPKPRTMSTTSGGPSIIHVNPDGSSSTSPAGSDGVVVRDPSAIGQDLRVAHLPDKALVEQSDNGPLPVRAADGRRPFDVYARPWSGARGARVAIVIGGLGVSQTGTQAAIASLPEEVTLAFAPQGNSLKRWMQDARQRGHEIVMQVPLEPFDYPNVNPGRNTLTVAASAEENLQDLRWSLSRITNYTGIMNYMGARFTADEAAMEPIIAELARRGLGYYDDGTSARSTAQELALKDGVPFAAADATIDAVRDRGEVLKKLDELERIARAKGFAVGFGSAFDVTVEAVAGWVREAKKRGIEIVPISAVANDPER